MVKTRDLTQGEINELTDLLSKVKACTPQTKRKKHPKKKRKPNKKNNERQLITDRFMKTFVDLDIKYRLYLNKFNTLSVTVHGFIPSNQVFDDHVIAPCMDEISKTIGIRDDTHVMLDLRTLFFVSHSVCQTILYQHLPWLHLRFNRLCVILPVNKKAREIITKAFMSIKIDLPPLEMKSVERARKGQEFLDMKYS